MCMHTNDAGDLPDSIKGIGGNKKEDKKRKPTAVDVPLGEGMADAAKISILSRREQIEKALADAGA